MNLDELLEYAKSKASKLNKNDSKDEQNIDIDIDRNAANSIIDKNNSNGIKPAPIIDDGPSDDMNQ